MKLRLLFPFIFILLATVLPAQTDAQLAFAADTARANALWDECLTLSGKGQFKLVLEKLDTAEWLYTRSIGAATLENAKLHFGRAVCHYNLADYALSIASFKKCLDIRRPLLGEAHNDVAVCYFGLGNISLKTGAYDDALAYFQNYRSVLVRMHGPENATIAKVDLNIGGVYVSKSDFDAAEAKYREVLALQTTLLGPGHADLALTYQCLANVFQEKGNYPAAIEYSQTAVDLFLTKFPADALPLAKVYSQLGQTYFHLEDARQSGKYFQTALDIQMKAHGPDHPEVAACYMGLSAVFMLQGDYVNALGYNQKAISIFTKKLGPDHPQLATVYTNSGEFCRRMGDYDKALALLQEGLRIRLEKLEKNHTDLAGSYLNIGVVYQEKGDYDVALDNYEKALAILQEKHGADHPEIARILSNSGAAILKKGDYDTALTYFEKALAMRQRLYGAEHAELSATLSNILELYRYRKQFAEGEQYAEKTLKALRYEPGTPLSQVHSIPQLVQALHTKGAFYFNWYKQEQTPARLYASRQAFEAAAQAIAYQDRYLTGPDSKNSLTPKIHKVGEGIITTNYYLQKITDSLRYRHEAFDYAEKSKSFLLYGAMQEAKAVRFAGLPDSLIGQEYQLRVDLAYFDKKRQEMLSGGRSETDPDVATLSTRMFELQQVYAQFVQHVEHNHPNYYQLRYDRSTATVRDVQNELLQPGQTLLEYVVGDSTLYVFVIGKDRFHIQELEKNFPLETWIDELRHSLTDKRTTGAATYCDRAYRLYEKLVAPVKELLTETLIIIPDGALGYLPFETLLSEKPDKPLRFQRHAYLLNQYRISYCYSATLLREMMGKNQQQQPEKHLLAAAPYFYGDTTQLAGLASYAESRLSLEPLRYSGEEVYGIQKIMRGDVLYGNDATKEQFENAAGKYRILHLATHGKANDRLIDLSFLAFTRQPGSPGNGLLYVRDIYNLALNADLVTLSACETGIGKLQKGEGIISLARAFAYAGAGSIVTSLWNVNDEQTKDLMLQFYRQLRKGETKSDALQTAKRKLAKKAAGHPYFWAGFIAIGDMRPLD